MQINFFRCKKCLMVSLRPRITFKNGICNACNNHKVLYSFNWKKRFSDLVELAKIINKNTKFQKYNCVVPVGGGKDSSYVAWHVKNTLGLRPICVFCEPPLFTKLGKKNLDNFINSGFETIKFKHTNYMRDYDKKLFKSRGMSQHAWLTAITIVPIKVAIKYNINYIFRGEEAESIYGGSNKNLLKKVVKFNDIGNFLLENQELRNYYKKDKLKHFKDLFFSNNDKNLLNKIKLIYWSNFEFWDEKKHFDIAKKHCGLIIPKEKQSNAINNHSHLDQKLYALHMYLAYIKLGFGRATTDASIAIRLGYMNRNQGIRIVKKKDNIFPEEFLYDYLKYFNISKKYFFKILKSLVNKKIFKNSDNLLNLKLINFNRINLQ